MADDAPADIDFSMLVTAIEYQLPVGAKLRREIYNLLGQKVKELADQR